MNPHPPLASLQEPRRRVAIYTRARDGENLRRQREDVERHAAQQPEWVVVAVYEEISRADKKRPALSRLIADANQGAIDVVVARDMSRLGRSIQDFVSIARPLNNCGVSILTSSERVDTDTPEWPLVIAVLDAAADSFHYPRPDFPGGTR